jgi:hypothetical protein
MAALHNYQAAVAVRASGELVRQDEIPAFVLGHDLGFRADRSPVEASSEDEAS